MPQRPTREIERRPAAAALHNLGAQLQRLRDSGPLHDPLMIGIHTGGVLVARELHRQLALDEPLGELDITFYRDDFTRIGLHPQVKPSHLPFSVDDRHIILVDDVLHSGRTVRAALNEIFDYGRPARVVLAVLVERNGRDLPIEPQAVGESLELPPERHVKLSAEGSGELSLCLLEEIAG